MNAKYFVLIIAIIQINASYSQDWHSELSSDDSFGIPFVKPDTSISIEAFDKNQEATFFSSDEIEMLYKTHTGGTATYEVQRIIDGNNIFTCVRFKNFGMWYRYTFWIHFVDGNRPAFRERVYIDKDTTDFEDANDLLVFQTHYVAFGMYEPLSHIPVTELNGFGLLEYIEKLLIQNCREHAKPWLKHSRPEFGNVSHSGRGFQSCEDPRYSDHDKYNENYELYLGEQRLMEDESSIFILFYPSGDFKALFATGETWIQFFQRYRSKENFAEELKPTMVLPYKRKYTIEMDGAYVEYTREGKLLNEFRFKNGFMHGPQLVYDLEKELGRIHIDIYRHGFLFESLFIDISESKEFTSRWTDLDTLDLKEVKELKKADRQYKNYCKKWKIAKVKRSQSNPVSYS